ncbi:MAG: D-alanine--D-alanine ligase [Anaerocolumna sp.]|jgi:D-alanine-D-alanine ligase|nr:D-alanine--D-alanine ligase [Anaerocolumna sp.]
MKIVVLAGGLSPERDVSLSSGSLIANSLMDSGHEVLLLDVYEGIHTDRDFNDLFFSTADGKCYEYTIPEIAPDLKDIKKRNGDSTAMIGKNVLDLCRFADVVFIALHGAMGENGRLQATLDNYGVKYTGTGYIGSLLAMDKDLTKKLIKNEGYVTADWILYNTNSNDLSIIKNKIGFPCVVKPLSNGSSIGVSIVSNESDLIQALTFASKYESIVLIEKKIEGREFSVGILKGESLPVIEIIPKSGFYDYKNKYQNGLTVEECPASLSKELTMRVQIIALNIHNLLRLGSYSRIDFILAEDNEFYCLEANTLPGMTPNSLIPQEALAYGISYDKLCEMIALSALN